MTTTTGARPRVLLIDDDEFILTLVPTMLQRLGIEEVSAVDDGRLALSLIDERPGDAFDLVICDLSMPRMDGLEILRHLAERGYSGAIVLVSGVDPRVLHAARDLAEARLLNVLGALEKPITERALADLLGALELPATGRQHQPHDEVVVEPARDPLAADLVRLYFLPRACLSTRRITGVEVLARWRGTAAATEWPGPYIDLSGEHEVAGQEDLVDALTEAVCRRAIAQAGAWQQAGRPLTVSVNVSIDHLARTDFPDFLIATANRHALDIRQLTLGVTAAQTLRNPTLALEVLARLRLKGVALSIEDLDLSDTSLDQLRTLPFTALKVDCGPFTQAADPATRQALERELAAARELGLVLVGGEIETERHWEAASRVGCEFAQGGYISQPLLAEELDAWLVDSRWL